MKKYKLIMVCLLTLTCFHLFSQPCGAHFASPETCLDTVPTEAIVVGSELTVGFSINQCYWVCEGANLSISNVESGNMNIDMEANSTLNFSGNESTIWAKEGCTINIGACLPIIMIHMEADVDVNFDGGGALCIIMDTCDNVIFNYSEAPSPGCAVAINDEDMSSVFTIFPNPAKNIIDIQIYDADFSETAFILRDMRGKIVLQKMIIYSGKETIPLQLPQLPAGIYAASFAENTKLLMIE